MLQHHEIDDWEEVAPGVRQRRHTWRVDPLPMEQAIELTGKLNRATSLGALAGHLAIVKLANREGHAVVTVLERSLHWCFQRDDDGNYRFVPESRESCDYDSLLGH